MGPVVFLDVCFVSKIRGPVIFLVRIRRPVVLLMKNYRELDDLWSYSRIGRPIIFVTKN